MKKHSFFKKLILSIISIISIVSILSISYFMYIGYQEYQKAISHKPLSTMVEQIRSDPDYVTMDNISDHLLDATVAIEDRRFYDHNGIDIIGIGRAAISSIVAKEIVGGGSTITQQLAKNMYFPLDLSFRRKIAEAFMARSLEKNYTKDEILELYVNIINYGDNYFGIYEASQGYFGKNPNELDLDNASLLAGLPQSPANFQLSNHMDAARIRQQQVLQAMLKEETITKEQLDVISYE